VRTKKRWYPEDYADDAQHANVMRLPAGFDMAGERVSHAGSNAQSRSGVGADWWAIRGARYPVSFWVSMGNAATAQPIKLTQTYNCGAGTEYESVTATVNATEG
jgi:hypothetical protein